MNPRIANAFRCPAVLTADDMADMFALWAKDATTAAKHLKRLQNAGGSDGNGLARNEAEKLRRARLRALKSS